MPDCLFVSDLHGRPERYAALFEAIERSRPAGVFLGGDLLPSPWVELAAGEGDFAETVLAAGFRRLRDRLGESYPRVFVILGNDDPRVEEPFFLAADAEGLWHYAHGRRGELDGYPVYGYSFVPPTPFLNKDWEKYDVSAYVPPGSVSPAEGRRSVPVDARAIRFETIAADLDALVGDAPLDRAILLVHTPPHETRLDRVDQDGMTVDHVPLDLHVGSIAVRRFIETRRPLLTLHGHIHESARLTGSWRDRIGGTHCLGAAHDGPELALVRFDPDRPGDATRELV